VYLTDEGTKFSRSQVQLFSLKPPSRFSDANPKKQIIKMRSSKYNTTSYQKATKYKQLYESSDSSIKESQAQPQMSSTSNKEPPITDEEGEDFAKEAPE
jgi:hypothetical protein